MLDILNTWTDIPRYQLPKSVNDCRHDPFEWQGMEFFAYKQNGYRATKPSIQERGFGNLYFEFLSDRGGIKISNSFHKLCHGGYNHTDFTKSQLYDVTHWVGDELDLDLLNAKLYGNIEIGVNVEHPDPKHIYTSQNRFKGNLAVPMLGANKQYGNQFLLGAYKVKTYDPLLKLIIKKEKPIHIPPNMIRFEIATTVSYLRKRGVNLQYVKDLLDNDNLSKLGNILYMAAKQIQYEVTLPDNMRVQDLEIFTLFTYSTKEQLQHLRKYQRASFYRRKKTFDILVKQYQINNEQLEKQIKQKWEDLMNS